MPFVQTLSGEERLLAVKTQLTGTFRLKSSRRSQFYGMEFLNIIAHGNAIKYNFFIIFYLLSPGLCSVLSCTPLSIPLLLPIGLLMLNVCISTSFSASSPPFCDLFPFPFLWFPLIYLLPLQKNLNPADNCSSRSSCEASSHGRCTLCRQ